MALLSVLFPNSPIVLVPAAEIYSCSERGFRTVVCPPISIRTSYSLFDCVLLSIAWQEDDHCRVLDRRAAVSMSAGLLRGEYRRRASDDGEYIVHCLGVSYPGHTVHLRLDQCVFKSLVRKVSVSLKRL